MTKKIICSYDISTDTFELAATDEFSPHMRHVGFTGHTKDEVDQVCQLWREALEHCTKLDSEERRSETWMKEIPCFAPLFEGRAPDVVSVIASFP